MSVKFDRESQAPPKTGLILLQCLILGLFCLFALRLWYLQVHKGDYFSEKARDNQLRQELLFAPRGFITDRNGVTLAYNEPAYALAIVREDCDDIPGVLEQISKWTGLPVEDLRQAYEKGKRRTKSFEPQIIVPNIPFELVTSIEANSLFWPGLEIVVRPKRHYPQGPTLAHVLGYVAEANEDEMERDPDLAMGDSVGKNGVELTLERRLRGKKGLKHLEVDAHGRQLSQKVIEEPMSGENITLSIDLGLQELGMQLLDGQAGAIVAMDPSNGQVLALVTQPSYDNNIFVKGVPHDVWKALREDDRHPLQNRAVQSTYPPGSVWKLLMAGCGLNNGMLKATDRAFCPGGYRLGTRVFRCWRKQGHGTVDLVNALIHSCDVYFYQLGERMGPDRVHDYAIKAGFGKPTGIDLPHEKGGIAPSREWKLRRFGEKWTAGETLNMSIGQGFTLVTPLQVARFISALVNGGALYRPGLVLGDEPEVVGQLPLAEKDRELILQAMIATVDRGTAKRMQIPGAVMGGKTGTAQVVRLLSDEDRNRKDVPYKYRDHAWVGGWGVKDGKALAVVCMVEHGGHGGETAVPVAKAIFERYFGVEKRPAAQTVDEVRQELRNDTNVIPPPTLVPDASAPPVSGRAPDERDRASRADRGARRRGAEQPSSATGGASGAMSGEMPAEASGRSGTRQDEESELRSALREIDSLQTSEPALPSRPAPEPGKRAAPAPLLRPRSAAPAEPVRPAPPQ